MRGFPVFLELEHEGCPKHSCPPSQKSNYSRSCFLQLKATRSLPKQALGCLEQLSSRAPEGSSKFRAVIFEGARFEVGAKGNQRDAAMFALFGVKWVTNGWTDFQAIHVHRNWFLIELHGHMGRCGFEGIRV